MKFKLTLFGLLIGFSIQAQTFQEFIKIGDDFYDEKKYPESAQAYEKAFALEEGKSGTYYNAACSWALTGDTLNSIKYLKLSANKGWRNLKHIKRDKDLTSLHSVRGWDEVMDLVQANLDEYEKDYDKPLKVQLEKIYIKDQTLRQLSGDAREKFGKDSDEMKYFKELIFYQDSLNQIEVTEIINKRGWVGKSLVGGNANSALWMVVQHGPIEMQEKYLPLVKESVLKGESRGDHLALLQDRILMRNDKPQIYGSQLRPDKETGKPVVYEIKDPEYVNQRRKEIGLGPIQDYIKRWGVEWTVEQKEK